MRSDLLHTRGLLVRVARALAVVRMRWLTVVHDDILVRCALLERHFVLLEMRPVVSNDVASVRLVSTRVHRELTRDQRW